MCGVLPHLRDFYSLVLRVRQMLRRAAQFSIAEIGVLFPWLFLQLFLRLFPRH